MHSSLPRLRRAQIPKPNFDSNETLLYPTCSPEGTRKFPPATSDFTAIDEGTASPRFVRSSIRIVPNSKDALLKSFLPFLIEVCPCGRPAETELPLPVIDARQSGIIRCSKCNAYLNSYSEFSEKIDRWTCNFCREENPVPPEFQCGVDGLGSRKDRALRPELCKGSVEYLISTECPVRSDRPPVLIFLVDVSVTALQSNFTQNSLFAIEQLLDCINYNQISKIGIVTFNHSVQFYDITYDPCHLVAMVDVDEPFCPLPLDCWLFDMKISKDRFMRHVSSILEILYPLQSSRNLQRSASTQKHASIASVLAVAESVSAVGGKIILLSQSPPLSCHAANATRNVPSSVYGNASELNFCKPYEDYILDPPRCPYMNVTDILIESGVCFDAILMKHQSSKQSFDISKFGQLVQATGGKLVYITPNISKTELIRNISMSLYKIIDDYVARDAALKIRCSSGLRCKEIIGPGRYLRDAHVEIPGFCRSHSMLCEIIYDKKILPEDSMCFIQAAFVYTSNSGTRTLRCHTLALQTSSSSLSLYKSLDEEVIMSYFLKKASMMIVNHETIHSLHGHRADIFLQVAKILAQYRKSVATESLAGQLVLPETLRMAPLYVLCIWKCVALRDSDKLKREIHPEVDDRTFSLYAILSMSTRDIINMIYPPFYTYHMSETSSSTDIVPNRVALSTESISGHHICLLEMSNQMYLYFGTHVPIKSIRSILGINFERDSNDFCGIVGEDELSNAIRNHIALKRTYSFVFKPVEVVISNTGTVAEELFSSFLVEDLTQHGTSYEEHLISMHKHILQYTN